MRNPPTRARIILRLRFRRPESTSETRLRLPKNGTKSFGPRPCCSIRKRIAVTGSGDSDSFPNGATGPWSEGFGAVLGQSEPRFGGAFRPAEPQPQNDPRPGWRVAHPGRRATGADPKRLNFAISLFQNFSVLVFQLFDFAISACQLLIC